MINDKKKDPLWSNSSLIGLIFNYFSVEESAEDWVLNIEVYLVQRERHA